MTNEERNALASGWMKRGIALMNGNTRASLTESLRCFDAAIELRVHLPVRKTSWFAYCLAACWMNKADALARIGTPETLTEALACHDRALTALAHLSANENPLYRRRLALCWMNRGHTLQELGRLADAIHSFETAIGTFRPDADAHVPVMAAALTNRANALLRCGYCSESRDSARESMALLSTSEKHDAEAAETALKARLIICQALAELARDGGSDDSIAIAIDHSEDGLHLAHHWEQRGETRFRPLAVELFLFGARGYQVHQPQFLAEFVQEHARQLPALRSEATLILSRAFWSEIGREGFRALSNSRTVRLMSPLRELASRTPHESDNEKQSTASAAGRPPI